MRLPSRVQMPTVSNLQLGYATAAAAGTNQATATALTSQTNVVTAADGTKGVALPDALVGRMVFILNTVTTAVLPVFGKVGGSATINGGSANAAVNLGPGQGAWFVATSTTAWVVADNLLAAVNLSGLLATAAEINRATDVSTRLVTLAVTSAITEALHEGRTVLMTGAGAARTFTMPAATGSGMRYRFVVGEVNTSGYLIKSVVGTDLMKGCIIGDDGGGVTTPLIWAAGSTDDTITLNGTTSGGVSIGDWVELEDITATAWAVRGIIQQSGSEITPFSDSVA